MQNRITMLKPEDINLTRIDNDVNGNPRYVCHFLTFITDADTLDIAAQRHPYNNKLLGQYELAVTRARKIGGKKYHTKRYGGGIVFQSYNANELKKDICDLVNNLK